MSRTPNQLNKTGNKPVRVGVVLPQRIVAQLDQTAAELAKQTPGDTVTRSDVVRRAVYAFLAK